MPRAAMTRKREPLLKKKKGLSAPKRHPPKAMTFDDESDDAFDPSPIPAKRRKLNDRVADATSADSDTPAPRRRKGARAKSRETDDDAEEKLKPAKKTAKVKNHVHVPQSHALLEDQFCTQEPELNSSPHRIRGPIWRKIGQISSHQVVRPVQPRNHFRPTTSKVSSTSESPEVSDDDDDSFEAAQQQQSLLKEIRRTVEPDFVQTRADRTLESAGVSEDEEAFAALRELDNGTAQNIISQRAEPQGKSLPASTTRIDVPDLPDASDDEDAFHALTDPTIYTTQGPLHCTERVLSPLPNEGCANPADETGITDMSNLTIPAVDFDIDKELADLPSDAFSSSSASPQKSTCTRPSQNVVVLSSQNSPAARPNLVAPTTGLRQITLFGDPTQQPGAASQANKRHNWPLVNRNEPPTHHKLDREALHTYVYPTNLGTTRDYQYNIVARGLYNNLLVALPTGLGKTFIAATIMLNWFRWTTDAQIVFVAPTKPLVSQQVEACFGIAGIPRSQTSMLTGGISPGLRAEEWKNKRVFFMTPQTIVNDLKTGIADPKRIVLLVVDEAHRATGGYAYVEVVKFIRRFNQSFRILALTATPGSSVESVQEVIDGLDIARVEIRTESSIDIRQYVHSRPTDVMVLDNTPEMEMVMGMFAGAVQPVLSKLNQFNAYWTKDPMALTAYGLTLARQKYMGSNAGRNASAAIKGMVNRIFSVLASLAHSIELLKFHGITPFYNKMKQFRSEQETSKGGKYEKEILDSDNFQKMMTRLQFWCTNPEFVGHPKLEFLVTRVLNHFLDAGEGRAPIEGVEPRPTRIMIFAHYRDSAEEIVRVLQQRTPTIRPHVFVGQAAAKGSEGMDQKRQLQIINEFKEGKYNTLVATSIGEEGLDIGEVDLIICYDSSASPIRMLQRMGRTGRKRAGKILLLLMRGKEEQSFTQAKDNYEKMQVMIAEGKRFKFHDEKSPRIVPLDIQPEVDKRVVEIPKENNEATLPEPSKKGRAPKRPPKKFHMPDGVRTGFVRASRMEEDNEESDDATEKPKRGRPRKIIDNTEPQPSLEEVVLTAAETKNFERRYLNVTAAAAETPIYLPRKDAYPSLQRVPRPFKLVQHGKASKGFAATLKRMHDFDENRTKSLELLSRYYDVDDLCEEVQLASKQDDQFANTSNRGGRSAAGTGKAPPAAKQRDAQKTPKPRGRPRKTDVTEETRKANDPGAKGGRGRPRRSYAYRDDDAMEAVNSSPPLTDPRLRLPSQGIALGSDDTSGEGEEDHDAMDSELADFINDEDEVEEERSSPTSSLSLPQPAKRAAPQRSLQNIFGSEVASESEDEGEEENLDTLLQKHRPGANGNIDHHANGNATRRTLTSPRKRNRNVVEDSSD